MPAKQTRKKELETKMGEPGFWDNQDAARRNRDYEFDLRVGGGLGLEVRGAHRKTPFR